MYNTDIKMKKENWPKFEELIRRQFEEGGNKYALIEGKEVTDWVCDIAGWEWILGTVAKYLGRFKNYKREKDLLKIATYCYILWLKHGFHEQEKHDEGIGRGDQG